ncbi:hypothetical protein [Gelidibacter salicanalis]|uniref:Uncharacterized protein n=1 Tax=Gelidibacter salicanalis TaxID=291193 RepID=A0A934NI17_9FLAO|nr:hypothetical protein [Gelidibacter salicanalis]MBJ7880513.1 hypothetical protein [Gelidibacter salicanalis]
MNYIKLLNAAYEKFLLDDRLNPPHISLYMALFQEWNSSRFAIQFYVNRTDLMTASKIRSKSSYHRCVTDLNSWNYLSYFPSKSPYKGSKIKMSILCTDDEANMGCDSPILEHVAELYSPKNKPTLELYSPISGEYSPILEQVAELYSPNYEPIMGHYSPTTGLKMGSTINNTKQVNIIKQPKGWQAVINFFLEKSFTADEGKKFFEHYENRNWKTSDGKTIRDWRALAANWMDRAELYSQENTSNKNQLSHPDGYRDKDNLRTTKTKDYGQPL